MIDFRVVIEIIRKLLILFHKDHHLKIGSIVIIRSLKIKVEIYLRVLEENYHYLVKNLLILMIEILNRRKLKLLLNQ